MTGPADIQSPHIAQLQIFLSSIGPKTLWKLQTLTLTGQQPATNILGCSKYSNHQLRPQTAKAIASLLATACPHITHLAVGGFVGDTVLEIFGGCCPSISKLELLDSTISTDMLHSIIQRQLLPHLTGVKLTGYRRDPALSLTALTPPICNLLQLHTQSVYHLASVDEWRALPPCLQRLECYAVPSQLHSVSASDLRLPALRSLHLRSPNSHRWNVEILSVLLAAAPKLHCISSSADSSLACNETLIVGEFLTPENVQQLQKLQLRLSTGLAVCTGRLLLSCGMQHLTTQDSTSQQLECTLTSLTSFPNFHNCHLSAHNDIPPTAACLSRLHSVFPNLERLVLLGAFEDLHLNDLTSCKQMRFLDVREARHVTVSGLVQSILQMPVLNHIRHPFSHSVDTATLQAMMDSASGGQIAELKSQSRPDADRFSGGDVCGGSGAFPLRLGRWVVTLHDIDGKRAWVRYPCMQEESAGKHGVLSKQGRVRTASSVLTGLRRGWFVRCFWKLSWERQG